MLRDMPKCTSLLKKHRSELSVADPCRVFQHLIKHRLELTGRTELMTLKHLGGRRLLLQRFGQIGRTLAQLLEQARVLDRDDGLAGEIADKFNLLVGERPDLLAVNANHADKLAFFEHRHIEKCSRTARRRPTESSPHREYKPALL